MNNLRIDGIYDKRTIKALKSSGISDFAFDFRPRSFNFLQQHIFLEILEEYFSPMHIYFLRYENEPDFIIKKMLDDLHSMVLKKEGESKLTNTYLEFSDNQPPTFYEQFQFPYLIEYNPEIKLHELVDFEKFRGLIFDFSFLRKVYDEGNFYNLVNNVMSVVHPKLKDKNFKLGLRLDWDADLLPSIIESIDFDFVSLMINQNVETCYRNVNLEQVKKELKRFGHYSSY